MCQMYGLAEASAVHLRIENQQQYGQQGETAEKTRYDICSETAPYPGDESHTGHRLDKCEHYTRCLGRE